MIGDPPDSGEPRPRRSAGTWVILLVVWLVGLAVWGIYVVLIVLLLLRVLA